MRPTAQRVVGVVVLLAAGVLSLPVSAFFLDGHRTESWVVPVQLLAMAAIGAGLAVALPALARDGTPPAGRATTGAWWGLLAAIVGVLVAWLALNGVRGA